MIRKRDDIVGSLFQDVAHLVRQRIDAELKPYGLTRLKWLAIGVLQDQRGLTQSELADWLELKPAATGRLVDRLVERGLVERRTDPDDRRAYQLFVTQKSDDLLENLVPTGDAIREHVLQDLDPQERAQLAKTLTKIKERLLVVAFAPLAAISSVIPPSVF
jgi:MarR family transcriptional regulator for hemolysin